MGKISAIGIITACLMTTACSGLSTTDQRVLSGGAIGAGLGAVATGSVGGAAAGSAIGAGAGYLYDRSERN